MLFLSGTTAWKLGSAAADLAAEAIRRGRGIITARPAASDPSSASPSPPAPPPQTWSGRFVQ